jgi:hypothetical protein
MRTDTRNRLTDVVAAASIVCVLFFSGIRPAAAAAQDAGDKVTSVDVGFDMGEPGATVSLSIDLNAPDGVAVGTTVNEITFPIKLVAFEEARSATGVDADVKAAVTPDPEHADNAIVQITVTARPGAVLSNGSVATAVFKIAEGAQAEALKLKNVARAWNTASPPAPITPVTGKDGEIELVGSGTAPAVVVCFFYMH